MIIISFDVSWDASLLRGHTLVVVLCHRALARHTNRVRARLIDRARILHVTKAHRPLQSRAQPRLLLEPTLIQILSFHGLRISSSSSSSNSSKKFHFYAHNCSMSAPVTPPPGSPRAQSPPRIKTGSTWGASHFSYLPSTTTPSPARQTIPNYEWYSGIRVPQSGPTSPTFSLVASNPFGFKEPGVGHGGSRMWTPGQSGTCSPAIPPGFDNNSDIPMAQIVSDEFAFGRVKPWQEQRIHEECGPDELSFFVSVKVCYV